MIQFNIIKEVVKEIWGNIKGLTYFIIALLVILLLWCLLRDASKENERLRSNETALLAENESYKTEAGRNAMTVKSLTLTIDQVREHEAQLVARCEELDIKLKRALAIGETGTQTKYIIKGEVRDSIVYVHDTGALDSLRCSDYKDPYLAFSYCVDSSGVYTADIETYDTITAIAHRIPRKFLFFRFGTKEIRQEVVCANPHTRITTATKIDIIK